MSLFVPNYEQIAIHKLMLSDSVRTHAYCEAISRRTNKDSVVVDFGSGTGVLSLTAAYAGAKRVYAIEKTSIAYVSKRIFQQNEASKTIELISIDSNLANFFEKTDLLVSEWMGVHVFQENMLFDLIDLRDRILKPEGLLIPDSVEIWLAPLKTNPILDNEILRWKEPLERFNFTELFELSINDVYIGHILPEYLAAEGLIGGLINLKTIQKFESFSISGSYSFDAPCRINGICGWFRAHLAEGIVLDTGPHSPLTHWQQAIYPFYPEIEINAGDVLSLKVVFEPADRFVNVTWEGIVKGKEAETRRYFSTKNNYTLPGNSIVRDK